MPQYRSRTTTRGRNMAGARGLWRAGGGDAGWLMVPASTAYRAG